jgi:hypothetical protein
MPETDLPGGPGTLWRFWKNLWGQEPDLRLETPWQKLLAFWGVRVPPPGQQDRLPIRPGFSRGRRHLRHHHSALLAGRLSRSARFRC